MTVKTSKSAVLSEATDYIAHLQRQQAHYEAERARMLQLLRIAQRSGALPNAAACGIGEFMTSSAAVGGPARATATVSPFSGAGSAASTAQGSTQGGTQVTGAGTPAGAGGMAGERASVGSEAAPGTGPGGPSKPQAGAGQGVLPFRGLADPGAGGSTPSTPSGMDVLSGGESATPGVPWGQGVVPGGGSGVGSVGGAAAGAGGPLQSQGQLPRTTPGPGSAPSAGTSGAGGEVGSALSTQASRGGGRSAGVPAPAGSATGAVQTLPVTATSGVKPAPITIPARVTPGMISSVPGASIVAPAAVQMSPAAGPPLEATMRALSHVNYERVFRTTSIPMAIANVNGNLVDCNTRLTQVTGFRREETLFMTIFDLVADPFLQHTFR